MSVTSKKRLQKDERKRQIRLAVYVCRRLGVKRKNSVFFTAVAAALGTTWNGKKAHGYDLVVTYAERHGIGSSEPRPLKPIKAPLPKVATDGFLLTFEWRRLRMQVLKKRGARCECCGASPQDGATVLNVDHIKPRKLFPDLALDESNLQVLCGACNHGKGNWDQTDWRVS